jgi:hypothetical protein
MRADTLPLTAVSMKRALLAIALGVCALRPTTASAHPAPFTYVDLRLERDAAAVTLVAHVFDVAHDLGLEPPERLLDAAYLATRRDAVIALLTPRVRLGVDRAAPLTVTWNEVEPLPDRQSIRLRGAHALAASPGTIALDAVLFPYDPVHQTFVNVYEHEALALQAILDRSKTHLTFYAGTRSGAGAVLRRFTRDGITHVATAPEHLLFLIALVLLGGSPRHLSVIVTAFVIGQGVALAVGTQTRLRAPLHIVEPASALALIYLGADNLMVKGGRDVRAWIALAAGALHGFAFAHALRALDLSATSVRWALVAFNLGVELVWIAAALALGVVLMTRAGRPSGRTGSVFVSGVSIAAIVGGGAWFVQRVFFPGISV